MSPLILIALLAYVFKDYWIVDMGSAHGTYVGEPPNPSKLEVMKIFE
jgi:hypothetical protein